jgi:acyl-CoA thioesterase I
MLRKLPPTAGARPIIPAEDVDMPDGPRPCDPHLDLFKFEFGLPNFAESLKRRRKTKVVAIGSSSTAGEPTQSGEVKIVPFPHRLELALRKRSYGRMIDVLNRGIGGQEAPEELSRFQSDVIAEAPALVIWQVGTNAVYRDVDYNPLDVSAALAAGLDWLAARPVDVVLMDLQYTTAIVEKLDLAEKMVARIAAAAAQANVNLFRRFDLMVQWVKDGATVADMTDPEDPLRPRLHMSEWATSCVTRALDGAIAGALAETTELAQNR